MKNKDMKDEREKKEHTEKKNKLAQLLIVVAIVVIVLVLTKPWGSLNNRDLAAVVNGQKITMDQLDKDYRFFFFTSGYPESYKQIISKDAFLNQTISQNLLINEAKKQGYEIDRKEVEEQFEKSLEALPVSKEDFMKNIEENQFTLEDVIDYSENQLLLLEFMNETIFFGVKNTEEELLQAYQGNLKEFSLPEQVDASHILVDSKDQALEILTLLNKGESFGKLATEISIDPSAKSNEGKLGFFSQGQMVKEFEDAAFNLKKGELSGPVKTDFGYHIIRINDKKEAGLRTFDEVKEVIDSQLLFEKQREAVQVAVDLLWDQAEIKIYLE